MRGFTSEIPFAETALSSPRAVISVNYCHQQGRGGVEEQMVDVRGYDDLTIVGSGGNAHVYRATSRISGQTVAVKIIRGGGEPGVRRRFERERSIMTKLEQFPNVVPILESGFTPAEDPFLAMPLYTGGSLAEVMHAGPTHWREAVSLTRKIAKAIESAHAKQILHLDIKPANVLLDEYGEPWVTDFGISEMLGSTASMSGKMLTPAYTPPERISGNKPSELTDIYGLGATLFSLLAGQPPYATAGHTNPMAMMMAVANDPVPIDDIDAELPTNVRNLILRSMAKDPNERPQTTTELITLLDDVAKGLPISGPESAVEKTSSLFVPDIATPTETALTRSLTFAPPLPGGPGVVPEVVIGRPIRSRLAAAGVAISVMFGIGAFALFGEDTGASAEQQRRVVEASAENVSVDEAETVDDEVDDDTVAETEAADETDEEVAEADEPVVAEPAATAVETEVLGETITADDVPEANSSATTEPAAPAQSVAAQQPVATQPAPAPTAPAPTVAVAGPTPTVTEAPATSEAPEVDDDEVETEIIDAVVVTAPPVTEATEPEVTEDEDVEVTEDEDEEADALDAPDADDLEDDLVVTGPQFDDDVEEDDTDELEEEDDTEDVPPTDDDTVDTVDTVDDEDTADEAEDEIEEESPVDDEDTAEEDTDQDLDADTVEDEVDEEIDPPVVDEPSDLPFDVPTIEDFIEDFFNDDDDTTTLSETSPGDSLEAESP